MSVSETAISGSQTNAEITHRGWQARATMGNARPCLCPQRPPRMLADVDHRRSTLLAQWSKTCPQVVPRPSDAGDADAARRAHYRQRSTEDASGMDLVVEAARSALTVNSPSSELDELLFSPRTSSSPRHLVDLDTKLATTKPRTAYGMPFFNPVPSCNWWGGLGRSFAACKTSQGDIGHGEGCLRAAKEGKTPIEARHVVRLNTGAC